MPADAKGSAPLFADNMPPFDVNSAEGWRSRASEARRRAALLSDDQARRIMLQISEECDREAQRLEAAQRGFIPRARA